MMYQYPTLSLFQNQNVRLISASDNDKTFFRRHGKGTVTDYPVFSAAGENRHSNDKPVPALEKRFALHAVTMHFFASSRIGSCNCFFGGAESKEMNFGIYALDVSFSELSELIPAK